MQNKELLVCHPKLWAAEAERVLRSVTGMGLAALRKMICRGIKRYELDENGS